MLNYINKNGIKESVKDYSEKELNNIGVYGPFLKFNNGNGTRCCVLGDNSNLVINNKHVMPNTGKLISSIINNNISLDLNPDTIYNFTLYSKNGSAGSVCAYIKTTTTNSYGSTTTSIGMIARANGGAGGAGVYLSLIDINDKQKYVAIGGGGGGRGSDDSGRYRGGLGGKVAFSINNIKHLDFYVLQGGNGGAGSSNKFDPDSGAGGGGGLGGRGGRRGGGKNSSGYPGDDGATINGLFLGGTGIDGTDSDYEGGTNGKLLGPSPIQNGRFGSNFLGSNTFSNVSSDSAYCKISYTY